MFTNTYFASKKLGLSVRGFKCSQLFATDFGFVGVRNLKRKAEIPLAMKSFFKDVGVPDTLVADGAPEQIAGESRCLCQMVQCHIDQLQPHTPWTNRAKLNIGKLKQRTKEDLKASGSPMVLWCYCAKRQAKILSATCRNIYGMTGQTPYSKLTGEPLISPPSWNSAGMNGYIGAMRPPPTHTQAHALAEHWDSVIPLVTP